MARPHRVALPPEAWPEWLQSAWRKARTPASSVLLPDGGIASRWRPATQKIAARGLGTYLAFLSARRVPVEPESWPEILAPDLIAAFIQERAASVAPITIYTDLRGIYDAARSMAPALEWRWLKTLADRLARMWSSSKSAADVVAIGDLMHLGLQLCDEAAGLPPRGQALTYRTGVIILLLCSDPLRARSFAALEIGTSFRRDEEGWLIDLAGSMTKTGRPHRRRVATALTPYVDRYVEHYRPGLLSRWKPGRPPPGNALWISRLGAPLTGIDMSVILATVTEERLGKRISMHRFRHCAATSIALQSPECVGIIQSVLDHGVSTTSERYYNLAGSTSAARAFNSHLLADDNPLNELNNI